MNSRPLNIVALGDCNTRGLDGCAGQIVPDLVESRLNEPGQACTLLNLGLTMSTTREGLAKLRDHSGPVDLLLVNYGLVDAWTTSLPGLYVSYYPEHRFKVWARKLLKTCKRGLRSPRIRRWLPVGEVVSLPEYERNLRAMIANVRTRSPQARIVLWGTAPVKDDPRRNEIIARYNETMRAIADTTPGVFYFDTRAALDGLPLDEILLDTVHLNAGAAGLIATGIVNLLTATELEQLGEGTESSPSTRHDLAPEAETSTKRVA